MTETYAPAVDVVIATHNRPELLRRALAAVREQTYPGPITCILVYDRSEPDLSLAHQDGRRDVVVIANSRTPGLAGARNSGILHGSGPLVAFCDDDDVWLPTKVDRQVEALEAAPEALTCVTGIEIQYGDHRTRRVPQPSQMTVQSLVRDRVMEAHPSTVLVRRDALQDVIGLVDEEIPGSYGEDYDWILRAAEAGPIAVAAAPLVEVTWGQSLFSQRWETIHDAIEYYVAKHPAFQADPVALGREYGRQAFALAALGRRREALHKARLTLRTNPRERRALLAVAVALKLVSAPRLLDLAHRRGHGI